MFELKFNVYNSVVHRFFYFNEILRVKSRFRVLKKHFSRDEVPQVVHVDDYDVITFELLLDVLYGDVAPISCISDWSLLFDLVLLSDKYEIQVGFVKSFKTRSIGINMFFNT